MTRTHRRWHAWLWLVIGPLVLLGVILAVKWRPAQPVERYLPPQADERGQSP